MKEIKVKYFTVNQSSIPFYVCVLRAEVLKQICSTSLNDIDGGSEIYQRKLDETRVKKISDFVRRNHGNMPTSIVLNARNGLIFDGDYIVIDTSRNDFFIVDGQHRIAGANQQNGKYEFVVSIFNKISDDFQSELFIAINNEQKKVNPIVRFSMKFNDRVKTPERVLYSIIYKLNKDDDSPFYSRIKINDIESGKNKISISAFASAFLSYVYNVNNYYKLKDILEERKLYERIDDGLYGYDIDESKYFLWKFYANDREDIMFKIILNYFNAVKYILDEDWSESDNILCKTTGFNALALLFKNVFFQCENQGNDFSLDYIKTILRNISVEKGTFTVENWGLGKIAATNLYRKLLKDITIEQGNLDYDVLDNMSEDY